LVCTSKGSITESLCFIDRRLANFSWVSLVELFAMRLSNCDYTTTPSLLTACLKMMGPIRTAVVKVRIKLNVPSCGLSPIAVWVAGVAGRGLVAHIKTT
jgi:hypothetical protein